MKLYDTICALSTPVGTGGISVIRISGEDAFSVVKKIYIPKFGKNFEDQKSYTVTLGNIIDESGFMIDEVLVTKFQAPNSFTGENVVEISCHGGMAVVKMILNELYKNGARSATGGEFSKRAFLNGKIDLSQAEAIIDIINANDEYNAYSGENQLNGILSSKINEIREILVDTVSNIVAVIDYPDEEIDDLQIEEVINNCKKALNLIEDLKSSYKTGKVIKEGAKIAICGKPNVGKSSLLNALLKEERAIVTDIAGTTRDVIEEEINIDGLKAVITDTAGLRDSDDTVEKIGINRAKKAINDADLILFVIDGSNKENNEDIEIATSIKDKNVFVIINKTDLDIKYNTDTIKNILPHSSFIYTSAKSSGGIDELSQSVKNSILDGEINIKDNIYITNERHMEELISASNHLAEVINALNGGVYPDIVTIDIENAISALGNITGQTVSEEIISNIFKKFCVGK